VHSVRAGAEDICRRDREALAASVPHAQPGGWWRLTIVIPSGAGILAPLGKL